MVCFLYIKFRRGLMMNVLVESLTVLSEYYSFSFTYIQFDPLLLARNPGTTVHNLNMHICHKIIVLYTSFNCYPMHNLSLVKQPQSFVQEKKQKLSFFTKVRFVKFVFTKVYFFHHSSPIGHLLYEINFIIIVFSQQSA